MVVLGFLLLAAGGLAIVAAVFTAEGSTELLGTDISALAMFLVGLGAGIAIWWGFVIGKFGTKRSIRQRRESKQLQEREKREADRRDDSGSAAEGDRTL